ncbi:hypothetical protein FOE78_18495 [Microlunatus elymi]|uniref:Peptidase MA-like domain-containing protein n=1 Tax=Microlunatus elymi TaxID=2596828 RepID=A0A516Q2H7_9ACTN|nr:basic secretory protein-like protein [Microlunatus elymi]QDP97634.1 hypothetical protein FOE78_18495 [Microlunatus elymi]
MAVAGLVGLLAGCSTPSAPPVPTTSATHAPTSAGRSTGVASPSDGRPSSTGVAGNPDRIRADDRLLNRLATALGDQDSTAFGALITDRDPKFTGTARMIFANLGRLSPTVLQLRATGRTAALGRQRRALLGPGAYAAEVQLRWQVPGDRAPSDQTVWMTFTPDKRTGAGDDTGTGLRWAGVTDAPGGHRPTPIWWLEPIRVDHDQHATVIGGPGVELTSWLGRADRAARDVSVQFASAPDGPWRRWNGRLVVIIPSSENRLEQLLGVKKGTEAALAAISWPDGSQTAAAPIRIMINSGNLQPDLGARIVLTHEAVHVATASPTSAAPTWLIEGFADYVAYRDYPDAQQAAARALLQRVSDSGAPRQLPTDRDFTGSAEDLDLVYAQSWLACRYLARRYGSDALFAFYAAVNRSASGQIDAAARTAFGIDQDQLVAGWRNYLSAAARRRQL